MNSIRDICKVISPLIPAIFLVFITEMRVQGMDKKGLKKKYKQTMQPMGVYQVKNLVSGKIFIGSSSDLPGKINSQKFQLNLGSHMNQELQNDYKLFGSDNFAFEVLDYLEPKEDKNYDYTDDLKVLKEMWIEKLSASSPKGYN